MTKEAKALSFYTCKVFAMPMSVHRVKSSFSSSLEEAKCHIRPRGRDAGELEAAMSLG